MDTGKRKALYMKDKLRSIHRRMEGVSESEVSEAIRKDTKAETREASTVVESDIIEREEDLRKSALTRIP